MGDVAERQHAEVLQRCAVWNRLPSSPEEVRTQKEVIHYGATTSRLIRLVRVLLNFRHLMFYVLVLWDVPTGQQLQLSGGACVGPAGFTIPSLHGPARGQVRLAKP